MSEPQRVFISYSHDNAAHDLTVLELANRLRGDGIDALLDRYESSPAEGWPRWMKNQVDRADMILVVCSKNYSDRFEGRSGEGKGATWEGLVLTQSLYETLGINRKKVVPVLLDGESTSAVPSALRPYTFFRYPSGYDALLRLISDEPDVVKPPLGITAAVPTAPPVVEKEVKSSGAVGTGSAVVQSGPASRALRSSAEALERVRESWRSGSLSVVVGAGASVSSGLPTWNELLNSLLSSYIDTTYKTGIGRSRGALLDTLQGELSYLSPLISAEFVRTRFQQADFIRLLHSALYRDAPAPQPGPIHKAIARLGHKLHSIVTFNYDDLLEGALRAEGHACTTVWKAADWPRTGASLRVYHPHGFLPYSMSPGVDYQIVLAEADYHTQYSQPYLWSNVAIARVLYESTCLFVGLSMQDPNLRRLLEAAHHEQPEAEHFVINQLPHVNAPADVVSLATDAVTEVIEASHQRLGVTSIWVNKYDEVLSILEKVKQL